MRPTRWFLFGVLLLGCDRPDVARRTEANSPSPAMVVFPSDSQGEEIRDIALGSRIWAVNRGAPSLARYSADGRLELHTLELGEGPDRVRTAWSVVAAGETAYVWDPLTRRLLRVVGDRIAPEATFEFATTHTISGMAFGINIGHPGRLRRFGSGWVTYATEGMQSHAFDLTQIVLLRFDAHGRVLDTIADLRSSPVFTDHTAWRTSGPKELVPIPLWDVCDGQTLVFFDPETLRLRWQDTSGVVHGNLSFSHHPRIIPESFLRAHLAWQLEEMGQGKLSADTIRSWVEQGFDSERWIYGTEEPYAVRMFCAVGGQVWLQRFSVDAPPRGLSRKWVVVDLRTRTEREVELPAGFLGMAGDSARIYGAVEGEDGVQQVAWIARP